MRIRIAFAAGILLILAACSDGTVTTTDAGGPTTTEGVTTTESSILSTTSQPSPTTTSVAPSTTITGGGGFGVVPPPSLTPPEPLEGSEGASGSGCAPGSDELPDGIWYVNVLEVEEQSLTADLACFYFGEIAWEIAALEGEEANNDFWIVNQSDRLRTLAFTSDAVAWSIAGDPSAGHSPLSLQSEWPQVGGYTDCPGEFCGVWVYVNEGVVTELVEQYIP